MADDAQTGLLVTIEARTAQFEKALARIEKKSTQGFGAVKAAADRNMAGIEKTLARANAFEKRMGAIDRSFVGFGRSLLPSLGAITAALSVREVAAYADAWAKAKNSLAVAGIAGREQAQVLDELYRSAQSNAAPLGALSDLFGKAAQASDNLGASNAQLIQFSDGVAVALKVAGTSAGQASGALTQLGQLLGSARVQAEEFNSVNEGARPILIAVANGLDKAGGSVSKLKQLVNDGEVSGKAFFEAFLKGLPSIEKMAANSTQTIEQGVTKISNAFTRYIGQTDESLSASQRLIQGMNALADNFDETADITLKLASVLAGALVGRGIAGMLATIPNAVGAMTALVAAMRAGSLTAVAFATALGPLGLIAGAATAAYLAFGNWGNSIDDATRALADQAASGAAIEAMIADVAQAQEAYRAAIARTAGAQTSASNSIVADTEREFNAKKSLLELELKRQRALVAVQQASLSEKSSALKREIGAFSAPGAMYEQGYADRNRRFVNIPDDISGVTAARQVIDNSPLTAEIQKIRAEMALTEVGANKLEQALSTTFSAGTSGGGAKAADDSGTAGKKGKGGGSRLDEYQKLSERIAEATAATLAENEALSAINPTVEDFGFAANKARVEQELLAAALKAGKDVTPQLKAEISSLATGYAEAEAAAGRLAEKQDAAFEALQSSKDITKGVLSDIRSALDDGKITWEEWGNIAVNVLDKILSKLEDQLVDALFSVNSASSGLGGGGGGNIFGTILTGIGSIFGFEGGGYTGAGAKSKPAGVVHADEFVFTKKATQRAGVGNLYRMMDYLETGNMNSLMRAGMPGFADGGYVGASNLPSMPSTAMQMSAAAPSVNDNSMQASKDSLQISLGWEKGSNGNIEPVIKEISRKAIADAAPGLLGAAKQQVLPAISEHQRKRAGGDWRNGG